MQHASFASSLAYWMTACYGVYSSLGSYWLAPRSITAARLPFFILPSLARLLGFIDFNDFGDLECLRLILNGSLGRLEAFCTLFGQSWGLLKGLLGRAWAGLGEILGHLGHFLEPLGALLGRSPGDLGPLGCLLGRLGGDYNIKKITCTKKINFQTPPTHANRSQVRVLGQNRFLKSCQALGACENDAKHNRFMLHLRRPGGMRRPPAGIIGELRSLHFEICMVLRHRKALRFLRLVLTLSDTRCSTTAGRPAEYQGHTMVV